MKCIHGLRVFVTIVATACVVGCSAGSGSAPSQSGNSGTNSAQTGSVYVLGTDAPLPSVVSFSVSVQSITLSDGIVDTSLYIERRTDSRFCAF